MERISLYPSSAATQFLQVAGWENISASVFAPAFVLDSVNAVPRNATAYATITRTPDSRSARRSFDGTLRSVIVCCTADVGAISERLRFPNLLESQTTIVVFALSIMARFTRASSWLGVVKP